MCVLRTWKPPGGGIWWLTLWAWGRGQQLLYWESKLAWPSRESQLNLRVDSGSWEGGVLLLHPPTLNCSALWILILSLFFQQLRPVPPTKPLPKLKPKQVKRQP